MFTGFGMIVAMAASSTVLQTIVEDDKRGRIMSFYTMAFMGMAPFGSLLAGFLESRMGLRIPFYWAVLHASWGRQCLLRGFGL